MSVDHHSPRGASLRGVRSFLLFVAAFAGIATLAAQQGKGPEERKPLGAIPSEPVTPLRSTQPRYWKGNLHTHSLWSDGNDFPEMIADWYKRHGYHFLTLSDHNILSEGQKWVDATPQGTRGIALKKYLRRFGPRWVERRVEKGKPQVRLKPLSEFRSVLEEPGKYLLIQGEEITHQFARYPVHMNAINLRDVIQPINGDSVTETIKVNRRLVSAQQKRTGRDMLAFLNHPNFRWGIRAEDMVHAGELRFFEIFNGHPGVSNYGDKDHPGCERLWDIVLALRLGKHRLPVMYGVATDDAHRYHEWGVGKVNPGRGWIMVQAPYLSAETIVRAMERGDFYCSTGVVLKELKRTRKQLSVTIQGEPGVSYTTEFIATLRDAPLTSQPRLGPDRKEMWATRIYSSEVGKVIREVKGLNATYTLTGKEIYVRAKITSSKLHPNPFRKGDVEVAWTQPAVP